MGSGALVGEAEPGITETLVNISHQLVDQVFVSMLDGITREWNPLL